MGEPVFDGPSFGDYWYGDEQDGHESINAATPEQQHVRDETVRIYFIKHVGPVARCVCGRDYVGGYRCPAAPTQPSKGDNR